MFSPLLILAFAAIVLHDEMGGAFWRGSFHAAEAGRLSLVAFSSLALTSGMVIAWCARRLDRTGMVRWARAADRVLRISRAVASIALVIAILGIGWLAAIRRVTGDLVGIDEALALTPLVAVYAIGWWAFYPIERRMREALVIRTLDDGGPMYPIPSRVRYVSLMLRQHTGLALLPMLLLLSIGELSPRLVEWSGVSPQQNELFTALAFASQLAGVALLFLLMPVLLRLVWDTVPIGEGRLGDRLRAMCARHRLGVRRLLLWRTGGLVLNGAVVGLIPGLRYILLTDALVDRLSEREIEAVTAHEAAHVLKHHMIWLVIALLGSVLAGGIATQLAVEKFTDLHPGAGVGAALVLAGSLALAFAVFGAVSRRFERQADAFAAREMTLISSPASDFSSATDLPSALDQRPRTFTPAGVDAMVLALSRVSSFNGVAPERFTWRHGSISSRIASLRGLVGRPLDRATPDRAAKAAKWFSFALFAASLGVAIWLPA